MSVMDETYRLRTYIDACTDHEMLLTSNPPKHRVTCTDVDLKPLIDAIESAYADDVIDAENRGYESGRNEGATREHYVELPKDADGEYIHIGDKLVGKYLEGNPVVECTRLTLTDDWTVGHGRGAGTPNLFVHHKPSTVEDVLEKALNEAAMLDREEGYWPSAADITNMVNELAPKLQLREED